LIISFQDDGLGINVERVKTKAIAKGILSDSEASALSEQEAYELLFYPGFTTKAVSLPQT
jgi:chemotaxis protein histidine kinase CheA